MVESLILRPPQLPMIQFVREVKRCTIGDCERVLRCKGRCNLHYHQLKQRRKLKLCACGCGGSTSYTFKHGHHTRLFSSAEQTRRGRMNSGDALRNTGQGKTYKKRNGRHEHRAVAEKKIGRKLRLGEVVHHKDHDKRNNAPKNIEVLRSQAEHCRLHALGRKRG